MKDNNDDDKKAKGTKKCVIKRKLKFQDYKNSLEASQLGKKRNHLQKNKTDVDSLGDQKEFIKNDKLIIKTQQRFESERHNVFTEEINKIVLSSNDDEKVQSIDLVETYAYGMNKDLVCKKEEIKCKNIIKQYKNVNFNYITKEDRKEHNLNCREIPDHPC